MLGTRAAVGNEARSFCKVALRLPKFHLVNADLATAIVYFYFQ